ncbi:Spore coat-associated protein [Lentibacillus sp. JNUCC-1]|uniref:TasA family protein n=1 Tax=Lentibacillus sp. JNUCC-1 TaxID=2654513 RepID=UPI0012E86E45|nr:TasA family protein [Lentibacillus sp. JNUCC-1]MUV38869.1 Spore coat-associated protein [Lentibacillus sp. JNUCC-1]
MDIKKKLGIGVVTAALGLSLVGGGTFAYFNDTETMDNKFASGTLELDVLQVGNNPSTFELTNLKPGDLMRRSFTLDNSGSLAIKNVWLDLTADGYDGQEGVSMDDYLDQFKVKFYRSKKGEDGEFELTSHQIFKNFNATLKDLVNGKDLTNLVADTSLLDESGKRVDIAHGGLNADPKQQQRIEIEIEFVDNGDQNRFQNTTADVHFNLEATQDTGTRFDYNNPDANNANGKTK